MEYGAIEEREVGAAARMIHHAFAGPIEGSEKWLREGGLEHLRVVREGGRAVACLMRIPMGQFFGGRSVKMLGIAGVAVTPEARGRGLARGMMERALLEARGDGFPIACLYASTVGLYRQVGYEQAGHRFVAHVPLHRIDVRERGAGVRALTEADDAAVRDCYGEFVRRFDGTLDRGPYVWGRVRRLREEVYTGFGVESAGGLGGYVFLAQVRNPETGGHNVVVSDLAFTDVGSARRLLGFLADFATMGENLVLYGSPLHPILSLLNERHFRVEKKDYWMVRVLDLPAAIAARGYAAGTHATVELRVNDPLIAENSGVWTVRVGDGRGLAERGSAGQVDPISCDVRAISPWYSGLYTPEQMAAIEWMQGSDAAITAAAGVMGGRGTPWMGDMF